MDDQTFEQFVGSEDYEDFRNIFDSVFGESSETDVPDGEPVPSPDPSVAALPETPEAPVFDPALFEMPPSGKKDADPVPPAASRRKSAGAGEQKTIPPKNTMRRKEPVSEAAAPSDSPPAEQETSAVPASAASEEPEEISFDPRFRLDRRQDGRARADYSYNGRRVSTSQDLHYTPPSAPEYEELHSSYTPLDDYDSLFREEEPAGEQGRKKILPFLNFASRKAKEKPAEHPETAETAQKWTEPQEETPAERKAKKILQRFHKEPEDGDFNDDLDDVTPASFGKYISSRIAGIVLKLRGNVPASSTSETMDTFEDEDLGPELAPMAASKYYGSQIYSLRLRTRISFLLLLIMTYISLRLPIPGMLQSLRVATAACLALQLTIMLLSLDIVTSAITNAFRRKFGADTLAVLSCLITTLDSMAVLGAESVYRHMPFCVISSLSLFGILLSSLLSARGLRKSLRVPAIGKKVYSVTAETNVTGRDVTLLKSARPITGFLRRMEEAPIDEDIYRRLAPFIFLIALVFSLLTAIIQRSPANILYILSSIFAPAVPFTSLLCFALPFFVGSHRIFNSGAALAGWSGISDIGYSKNLIVTDRDLFPAENIEIDNVRIFADYDSGKVIAYAGSIILASKCGLAPSFSKLMDDNECTPVKIDNLQYLAGGGFKGMTEGHVIICGSSDLMRLMNVRIPYRLISQTSVLLAIDGILYGIFNIKYTPDPKVRKALVTLMRSNRHPIFAIRDFNITPEFIHETFDVATDGYDFPPYIDRFPISEAKPSEDSQISAVICREGLGPLTDLADTGRSIFVVSRLNTLISVVSAVLGLLISFFRIVISGSTDVGAALLMVIIFSLPVLILGLFTTSVN